MMRLRTEPGVSRWGRLTYVSDAPDYLSPAGHRARMLRCRCDCGEEVVVRLCSLRRAASQSCGCLQSERTSQRTWKHGHSKNGGNGKETYLYKLWVHMRDRCENPANRSYPAYGGRGITVAAEWHRFETFLSDILGSIGERPQGKYSLDRIDNDSGYRPGNVRWALPSVQGKNTRRYMKVPVGQSFGDLTILREGARGGKYPTRMVLCRCRCGSERMYGLSRVLRGEAHRCWKCGKLAANLALSNTLRSKRRTA